MKCSIMQPSFIPWPGWFSLLIDSDYFIILDDVQFSKQSWHQRNYIKNPKGELHLLSLPVQTKNKNKPLIKEVYLANSFNSDKILRTISQNYLKSPFYSIVFKILEENLKYNHKNLLANLNINIINAIIEYLKIENKTILLSSEINTSGIRGEYVANLCNEIGAKHYLSPYGSYEYLKEDIRYFSGISILLQQYKMPIYERHKTASFLPCSIIDLLFNQPKSSLIKTIQSSSNPYLPFDTTAI